MSGELVATEFDFGPGLRMEERIDACEHEAITERWEFGKWMLEHVPEGGKKLPDGFLDGLSDATGKSRTELQYRRQFAERYPSREALSTAVDNHASWTDIREQALPESNHRSVNSGENEWYTPLEFIEAAVAVMGQIDLDPASTPTANEVVGASTFFTAEEDGLAEGWLGSVWMNPPYARPLVDAFCEKLAEEYVAGNVTEACVLVNNATETSWFQVLTDVMAAVFFPAKRVRFWYPERKSAAPLQGQAVLYLGPNADAFRNEFSQRISGWSAAL